MSPAIVSPETIDVEFPKDKSESAVRKGLRLVARSVQTLVNQLFSGDISTSTNTLLQESGGKIYDFLDNLLVYMPFPFTTIITSPDSCDFRIRS